MNSQPTVLILDGNKITPASKKLISAYTNNGYIVGCCSPQYFDLCAPTYDVVIVNLDEANVQDSETFKRYIASFEGKVKIICSTSFERLKYYKEFETYTSVDNLLDREFFAH